MRGTFLLSADASPLSSMLLSISASVDGKMKLPGIKNSSAVTLRALSSATFLMANLLSRDVQSSTKEMFHQVPWPFQIGQ